MYGPSTGLDAQGREQGLRVGYRRWSSVFLTFRRDKSTQTSEKKEGTEKKKKKTDSYILNTCLEHVERFNVISTPVERLDSLSRGLLLVRGSDRKNVLLGFSG